MGVDALKSHGGYGRYPFEGSGMKRVIICFLCCIFILPLIIGVTPSLQWGDTPLKTNLPPVVITGKSTFKIVESRQIPIPSANLPGGKERPVIAVSTIYGPEVSEGSKRQPLPKSPGCTYRNAFTAKVATLFKGDKAYDKRGKYLFLNHRYTEAIETFRTLIGTYPESPKIGEAYFWIGECYFKLGDLHQAEQHYRVAVQKYPTSLYADYAVYSLGWIAYKKRAFHRAIKFFKQCILSYPNSPVYPQALFWLAESYFQNQQIDQAYSEFKRLLAKSPSDTLKIPALFDVAKIEFLKHEYRASKTTLQGLLKEKISAVLKYKTELMMGWCDYFLNDPKGLLIFSKLLEYADLPRSLREEAAYGKCMAALQAGKPRIAAAIIDKRGPDFPWYGDVAIAIANYYFNQKRCKDAEEFCGRIFQEFPKPPYIEKAYLILGNCAYNKGDFSHATEYYTHVILGKEKGLVPAAIFAKGLSFYQLGMFRNAIDSWEVLLKQFPDFPRKDEVVYWLGSSYLNLNREDVAISFFERLKHNGKIYPKALAQLAQYWFGQQSWKKALRVLHRFLSMFPSHKLSGFAKGMIGEIYFNLKSYGKASQWIHAALKDPETKKNQELLAKLTYILGQISYRLGDYSQAASFFSAVVSRFPKTAYSDDALYWKATSYYSQRRYEKALMALKELVKKFPDSPLVPETYLKIADCYYNLRKYRLSDAYYQKIAKRFNKGKLHIKAFYGKILSLYQRGDYIKFSLEAKKFLRTHPASYLSFDVLQLLAEYYEKQGALEEEIELYDRFLKAQMNSRHSDTLRLKLASLFSKKGLYNPALVQLRFVSANSRNPSLRNIAEKEMGDLYFKQKLYHEAIVHYNKYIRSEKLTPSIIRQVKKRLITAYIETGKFKKAESNLEQSGKILGLDWSAPLYISLGKAYQKRKMLKASLRAFRNAAKTSDTQIKCRAMILIADTYRKTKKYDKSLKTLLMVRYSYPECSKSSEKMLLSLAVLMGKRGKKVEARQLLMMLKKSQSRKIRNRAEKALKHLH